MDCPFNFSGLVVGLVEHVFLPTVKTVAAKFFDVDKTIMEFSKIKS